MNGIFDECNIKIDKKGFHKMIFIWNALENGWKVKKNKDCYIFTKKHEGKKEILNDSYLEQFIFSNMEIPTFDL